MNEPKPKGVTNNPDIYREFLVNWKPDEIGKCFACGMVRPCHRIEDRLVCTPCYYNDALCDVCGQKAIPGISGILVCYERYDIRCLCHEHMHMADEEGASGIEPECSVRRAAAMDGHTRSHQWTLRIVRAATAPGAPLDTLTRTAGAPASPVR